MIMASNAPLILSIFLNKGMSFTTGANAPGYLEVHSLDQRRQVGIF